MFAWVRSLFQANRPATAPPTVPKEQFDAVNDRYRELKAKYDAAQTNDDNRRHWGNADGLSAASANREDVRRILRNRSRYEYDNGAYCNGIIRTRADDLVGTGPTLQILTDDDDLNEKIEQAFASWARASCFAEKLHTMDQTRCRDGEAFALLVNNPRLKHPVQLDLKLVEADQVADVGFNNDPNRLDGIEYDALGNPIAYHVLTRHPGDNLSVKSLLASERIDERFVLHWYRKDRPGQLRGVPELTSSLANLPYMRRWTLATLAAAETAANFAIVLENANGNPDANPVTAAPFSTVELERNLATELPAGVAAKQIAPEHPGPQFGEFKRETCNEIGRPVRMPANVVSADSSKHNYSSAKLDHFGYRGGLGVDRYFAAVNHLDKVFGEFVTEARQIPGLLPAGVDVMALPRAWFWPGWASMDSDQSGQDNERLANGTLTLADYWAQQGHDWKTKIRQRGKEIKFATAEGVVPEAPAPAPGKVNEQAAAKASPINRLNGHRNGHSGVLG